MNLLALLPVLVVAFSPPAPPKGPMGPGHHGHGDRPHRMAPSWLDSAQSGITREPWSGIVELQLPMGRLDTAKVCGGPLGFRIEFGNGRILWETLDSSVHLDPKSRTARTGPRRPPPGPHTPMARPALLAHDTLLGRPVSVFTLRGPRGGSQRLWIDTTLPLLLRGEGPGPLARRMLSFDPRGGCPEDAFQVPEGYTTRRDFRHPPPSHEVPSLDSLRTAVGFPLPTPGWLPPGFEPAGQGWIEGRRGRIAHLRWSDGARLVSLFVHSGSRGFRPCEENGRCPLGGEDPALVLRRDGRSFLVTGPLPEEQLRRIVEDLR
ncbi:MAG: hypothetical protein H6686_10005 [Fibrobacteria bacterium]|nr:hypothetical protein [Fibrobacteria bacterium]